MDYNKIIEKQEKYLESKDKLSSITLESYENAFAIEYTHNSTAIEGNTLSLIETKVLLEDDISIGGKKLREIYEVVNHHNAYEYVKKCIREKLPLDEKITKNIHAILTDKIMIGGIYRNEQVYISGAKHTPPPPQKMYEQIKNFYLDLAYKTDLNPIELAAWTHAEFVHIHPFIDGNGRTSRLLMNYQLMANNFPPVSIEAENRLNYYNCLEEYSLHKNIGLFADMIAELVEKQLDIYLGLIKNI